MANFSNKSSTSFSSNLIVGSLLVSVTISLSSLPDTDHGCFGNISSVIGGSGNGHHPSSFASNYNMYFSFIFSFYLNINFCTTLIDFLCCFSSKQLTLTLTLQWLPMPLMSNCIVHWYGKSFSSLINMQLFNNGTYDQIKI